MLLPSAFMSVFGWYPQEHSPFRSPTHSGGGWTFALTHLIPGQEWTSHLSIMFPPSAIKCFHTHVSHLSPPFFLFFAKSQWAIQSTDSPSLSLSHPRGSARSSSYSSFFFCVKCLHSNAAQQPGDFFSFLPPLFSPPKPGHRRPTGTYLVFLHPHSGLRANCRVWSVCKLIEISHSSPHLRLVSPCLNLGREGWSVTFSLCNPFDRD